VLGVVHDLLECRTRKATESAIIRRFSGKVVWRACVTWKGHDFPKIVATGVRASTSAWRLGSASAETPARRVAPKAATRACFSGTSRIRRKKRMSLGFDPGQPPSM
jgi:hypothetical protein